MLGVKAISGRKVRAAQFYTYCSLVEDKEITVFKNIKHMEVKWSFDEEIDDSLLIKGLCNLIACMVKRMQGSGVSKMVICSQSLDVLKDLALSRIVTLLANKFKQKTKILAEKKNLSLDWPLWSERE